MQFNATKIPKKITPCPIVEAVVELRFKPTSGIPKEAIPGILFSRLVSSDFSEFNKLPVTEIPEFVRENDPNLKYAALYASQHRKIPSLRFQFGPRTCTLVSGVEYTGWATLHDKLGELMRDIHTLSFVKEIERVGLRYISFFKDSNVFNHTRSSFELAGNSMLNSGTTVRSEFQLENFTCTLQISNTAQLADGQTGSLIDIDVFKSFPEGKNFEIKTFMDTAIEAHNIEKKVFFGLLKPEYLEQLNPEY
ncbi:MAG TPA: TIGR04255 family protein [Alphaproteobacteria bacterium]|nr:TIGR04255 family protein [Alphaproteobacteria bacterium]